MIAAFLILSSVAALDNIVKVNLGQIMHGSAVQSYVDQVYHFDVNEIFDTISVVVKSECNLTVQVFNREPGRIVDFQTGTRSPYILNIPEPKQTPGLYILVKGDYACEFDLLVVEPLLRQMEISLPSVSDLTEERPALYEYTVRDEVDILKITGEVGTCHCTLLANDHLPSQEETFLIDDDSDGSHDGYLIEPKLGQTYYLFVYSNNPCQFRLTLEVQTIEEIATPLTSEITYRSDPAPYLQTQFFIIDVPIDSGLYLEIRGEAALMAYLKQDQLPSPISFDEYARANNSTHLLINENNSKDESGSWYLTLDNPLLGAFTIKPIFFTEKLNFLYPSNEVQVNGDDPQQFIFEFQPNPTVDIIVKISNVKGEVELFAKICHENFSQCHFYEEEIEHSFGHKLVTHERSITTERYVTITVGEKKCPASPCWLSLQINLVDISEYRIQAVANEAMENGPYILSIPPEGSIVIKHFEENRLLELLDFKPDCSKMSCSTLDIDIAVSRMSPDVAIPGISIFRGRSSQLWGTYYVKIVNNSDMELNFHLKLDKVVQKQISKLRNGATVFDIVDNEEKLYALQTMGSQVVVEDIELTVTPLSQPLQVCIQDVDGDRQCTEHFASQQRYVISKTDFPPKSEFQIGISQLNPGPNVEGEYFIIKYTSGDGRYTLDEATSLTTELNEVVQAYKFPILRDNDVWLQLNCEVEYRWGTYLINENNQITEIQQYRVEGDDAHQHVYIPWELVESQEDREYVLIYLNMQSMDGSATVTVEYTTTPIKTYDLIKDYFGKTYSLPSYAIEYYAFKSQQECEFSLFIDDGTAEVSYSIWPVTDFKPKRPSLPLTTQSETDLDVSNRNTTFALSTNVILNQCRGNCYLAISVLCVDEDPCSYRFDTMTNFTAHAMYEDLSHDNDTPEIEITMQTEDTDESPPQTHPLNLTTEQIQIIEISGLVSLFGITIFCLICICKNRKTIRSGHSKLEEEDEDDEENSRMRSPNELDASVIVI